MEGPNEELWSDFKAHDVKKQTRGEEKKQNKTENNKTRPVVLKTDYTTEAPTFLNPNA